MKLFRSISKIIRVLPALLTILAAESCVKEDMSMCDLYLKFRYDYNMTSQDLFSEQVREVKVFIFDSGGKYVTSISESGETLEKEDYRMKIPYELYGHTIVVWAGNTGNFYTIPRMSPGDPIEKLTLQYSPDNYTCTQMIDDLWHSGPSIMTFKEENNTTQTVSLTKDTNDINIQLTDKNGNSILNEFTIVITSANGAYDHMNRYMPHNPVITYRPYGYTGNNNQQALSRILRLTENSNPTLTVTGAGGAPVDIAGQYTVNLANYFLMSTPQGMEAQEYLDRCYRWNVSLIVENGFALAISVNGWVHWIHPTEM